MVRTLAVAILSGIRQEQAALIDCCSIPLHIKKSLHPDCLVWQLYLSPPSVPMVGSKLHIAVSSNLLGDLSTLSLKVSPLSCSDTPRVTAGRHFQAARSQVCPENEDSGTYVSLHVGCQKELQPANRLHLSRGCTGRSYNQMSALIF